MRRIVFDTNVIVAALRSKRGTSYRLLMLLDNDSRFEISLSVSLAFEYEEVLKRQKGKVQLSYDDVDDFVDYICSKATLRNIFYLWRPALRDPDDDFVLELAIESKAEFIVTFNIKDFRGADNFGVKVIRPSEFLRMIEE